MTMPSAPSAALDARKLYTEAQIWRRLGWDPRKKTGSAVRWWRDRREGAVCHEGVLVDHLGLFDASKDAQWLVFLCRSAADIPPPDLRDNVYFALFTPAMEEGKYVFAGWVRVGSLEFIAAPDADDDEADPDAGDLSYIEMFDRRLEDLKEYWGPFVAGKGWVQAIVYRDCTFTHNPMD